MNLDIQFDRLSVIYGDLEAVRNVSFHLPAGKVYGLLGRNGAGKTSLLSVLASFREPSSGSVTIGGEQPFENAKIMREVSFIYDVDYKDETDKVKAAIESVARYRPHFDTAYALELARKFNLPLDKQLKQLSKGMQSAFNVCIGLASRSPVTILDEVYLGMDAPSREIFTGSCWKTRSAISVHSFSPPTWFRRWIICSKKSLSFTKASSCCKTIMKASHPEAFPLRARRQR